MTLDYAFVVNNKQLNTFYSILPAPYIKKQREEFVHKIKIYNACLTITNILNTTKYLHAATNFVLSTLGRI